MIPRIKNAKLKRLNKFRYWIMKRILPFYMFWILHINRNIAKRYLLSRKEAENPKCTECGLCCLGCPSYNHKTKLCNINYSFYFFSNTCRFKKYSASVTLSKFIVSLSQDNIILLQVSFCPFQDSRQ